MPNAAEIAAKSVEISKSLVDTQVGLHGFDLATTRSAGDLARFATAIRRTRAIDSRQRLAAISQALKIEWRLLEHEILPTLEGFGWLDIRKDGKTILGVEESIPPITDVLSTVGKYWDELNPTEIDRITVAGLSELSKRPYERSALVSDLNANLKSFDIAVNYGNEASYMGSFKSKDTAKDVIWSPLYWARNADKVQRFLEIQSEPSFGHLARLTKQLRTYPGLPIEKIPKTDLELVRAGIHFAYFPTPCVQDSRGGKHDYIFAASPEFDSTAKSDLFETARLIVACIRHGQYHAEITRIMYPSRILKAMRTNTLGPHSYAKVQYFLLEQFGVVRILPLGTAQGKRYKVEWIDTPENNLAADIAESLLKAEEPIAGGKEELEAKKILITGVYNYTSEQRRIKASQALVDKTGFQRLMEYSTGVRV